ncbi:hypothetical protein ACLHDG_14255 [Sulfurovum sp. CS9]|uniref:hypothetical protein n=1 Tax=Sulfurovum sp. CS9 TaxID=3391146 RepID=UPI0039E9C02A
MTIQSGKTTPFPLPFTTQYQKEAQQIVKTLWKEQQGFLENNGERWLNQEIPESSKVPTINIYRFVVENEDNCEYVYIKVKDLDKYSSYADDKKIRLTDEEKELMGAAIIAIMDIYKSSYFSISELHRHIVEIHKSDLNISEQKYFIKKVIEELDIYIDNNIDELAFVYPIEMIRDLNDIHLYHEWIEEGDSFIIQLALNAYREIAYYNEWLEKHKIEEKRFREKITTIMNNGRELRELTNAKPPFYNKLPKHPQDILHDLASNYWDYYEENRTMRDDGVQGIIKIISDYKRMPKKSIQKKALEKYSLETSRMQMKMKKNGATQDEITSFIMERAFGKKITYIGNN